MGGDNVRLCDVCSYVRVKPGINQTWFTANATFLRLRRVLCHFVQVLSPVPQANKVFFLLNLPYVPDLKTKQNKTKTKTKTKQKQKTKQKKTRHDCALCKGTS